MKRYIFVIVLILTSSVKIALAQEVFRIDSTSTAGLCLKGFVVNEPERICIKPNKIITKPKPPTGCVLPWTARDGQCVAVLKVSKAP